MAWKLGVAVLVGLIAGGSEGSQPRRAASRCALTALAGSYGFSVGGINLRVGDFAMVGQFRADGNGNVDGVASQSVNGSIYRNSLKGTYTIDADCTGTANLAFPNQSKATLSFVIVNGGRELYLMMMDPGTIEYGSAKKITGL